MARVTERVNPLLHSRGHVKPLLAQRKENLDRLRFKYVLQSLSDRGYCLDLFGSETYPNAPLRAHSERSWRDSGETERRRKSAGLAEDLVTARRLDSLVGVCYSCVKFVENLSVPGASRRKVVAMLDSRVWPRRFRETTGRRYLRSRSLRERVVSEIAGVIRPAGRDIAWRCRKGWKSPRNVRRRIAMYSEKPWRDSAPTSNAAEKTQDSPEVQLPRNASGCSTCV